MATSSSWERRNARARALGYRNYYDYRAHFYGRRDPAEPAARGSELARLRGHRSFADLMTQVERGTIELAGSGRTTRDPETGRFNRVEVLLVDAQGRESRFVLNAKKLSRDHREALAGALAAAGARVAGYLKTLLRGITDLDLEEASDEEEAA